MLPRILLCRYLVLNCTSVYELVLLITSTLTCKGSIHQTCRAESYVYWTVHHLDS